MKKPGGNARFESDKNGILFGQPSPRAMKSRSASIHALRRSYSCTVTVKGLQPHAFVVTSWPRRKWARRWDAMLAFLNCKPHVRHRTTRSPSAAYRYSPSGVKFLLGCIVVRLLLGRKVDRFETRIAEPHGAKDPTAGLVAPREARCEWVSDIPAARFVLRNTVQRAVLPGIPLTLFEVLAFSGQVHRQTQIPVKLGREAAKGSLQGI